MEDYFKNAWKASHEHKNVPAIIGGNYVKFLRNVTEKAEKDGFSKSQQAMMEFYTGDDAFYREILKESSVFFGAESFVRDNDSGMFLTFAGRPHMDKTEFIPGEQYWSAHDHYFGTRIGKSAETPVGIAPHHVAWLLGKNSAVSWEVISQKLPEEQEQLLKSFSGLIKKDRTILKKISGKDILTSIAIGFEKEIDPISPQSVETIHVHNIASPEANLSFESISANSDNRRKDIINPYILLIKNLFSKETKTLIDENFADIAGSRDGCSIELSDNPFRQISFDVKTKKGTELQDVLQVVANLYAKLREIWTFAKGQSKELPKISNTELLQHNLVEKIAGLREKPSRRFPKVPAYNVIIKWSQNGAVIDSVSIAPSTRGPAEKMRGGILIRK